METETMKLPTILRGSSCSSGSGQCSVAQDDNFFPDATCLYCPIFSEMEYCKDLDDSDLVNIVRMKDGRACNELHARYQKKLFTYILRLVGSRDEAEDILQGVFLKTFKNIHRFDTSRKFSSWIYRIAHNESVNFLKRKSKRYLVSWDDITTSKDKLETASSDESLEDKWAHQEITKEISEALEKLPQKYRRVLDLRFFKEHSYEDIGNILGKPVNTVGTLINRAKKSLLDVVQQQDRSFC